MTVGNRVRCAIEMECTAIKAGNVHPYASFQDLSHKHFLVAAKAIGETIDGCIGQSVGQVVLRSVQAMMESVGTNTSLGTILLMSPLVVATNQLAKEEHSSTRTLPQELRKTLLALTPADSDAIYQAIRMAKPGGLGNSRAMDIRESAPQSILDAMKTASAWDDIALQFISDFELVHSISRRIEARQALGFSKSDAIRCVQIAILSERVDSLIARKQGIDFARKVQSMAIGVIAAGPFESDEYEHAWKAFDLFLRDANHRGNPGTIADLIAAALF